MATLNFGIVDKAIGVVFWFLFAYMHISKRL